jgi:hypothetical protein
MTTNDEKSWAITLWERYLQLFGEPVEQPITAKPDEPQEPTPGRGTGESRPSP